MRIPTVVRTRSRRINEAMPGEMAHSFGGGAKTMTVRQTLQEETVPLAHEHDRRRTLLHLRPSELGGHG